MEEWRQYRRKALAEMRPYQPGEMLTGVSISEADRLTGSPKAGDMIARNPKNHADQWLVAAQYFKDHFVRSN
jgi:hypothetical protein